MGKPNIYPTGTTIYDPSKCFNGFTLMPVVNVGVVLVDMNGNVVHTWKNVKGFPTKLLKGGSIIGSLNMRPSEFAYQDMSDVTQINFDGKVEWSFKEHEQVTDDGEPYWCARQHHDFEREGNPVGYYVPGQEAKTKDAYTLILCHEDLYKKSISEKRLLDDVVIQVNWDKKIVWKWRPSDHFREFGFDEATKNLLFRNPNHLSNGDGQSDWLHINSMSELGPNHWYDEGDERFNPKNLIIDSREANILFIVSRETGKIVWKIGPDFRENKQTRKIGQIIGQHHLHMIPKGLPGEGNLLVFDNGGWAGYGIPTRTSRDGTKSDRRDYSRVLEINPTTLEVVWEYDAGNWPSMEVRVAKGHFYSPLISSAQRLPNGNTLIDEGCDSRMIEVTKDKEIVWEYIAPFEAGGHVYRAYRYPYSYVPQIKKPVETPVERLDITKFRVPGAAEGNVQNEVTVEGAGEFNGKMDSCVKAESLK